MCVAAEMQDAEGFGAVEEIWADEENEEEFSAAPEVGNEDLNGFQAEFPQRKMTGLRQKNLVRSSPVLLQEIPLIAASAFFFSGLLHGQLWCPAGWKCKGLVQSSGAELCGGLQPVSGQR